MSKKTLFLVSLGWSIPISLVAMMYISFSAPLGSLLWCMFAGYCTTNLYGAAIKDAPKIIVTWAVGIGWALAYNYFFVWVLTLGMGLYAAMFADVFVITMILMLLHLGPLSKTFLSKLPMLFPPVFCLFASGADMKVYPFMILSMLIGSFTAIFSGPFTDIVLKLFTKKQPEA